MKIPQIDNGKTPEAHLHIIHMIPLPTDTPFGNLGRKTLDIVTRIDQINLKIRENYKLHSAIISDEANFHLYFIPYSVLLEEITYWLRKTSDEIIMLISLLKTRLDTGKYPQRIECQEIGSLLRDGAKENRIYGVVEPFLKDLSLLNEISNAFKHSFLQTDLNLFAPDAPKVYSLPLQHNDITRLADMKAVYLEELVDKFSLFYLHTMQIVKRINKEIV